MSDASDVTVRPLTFDDRPAAWELGRLAFGGARGPVPEPDLARAAVVHEHGVFDVDGGLLAKAIDLEHTYLYGGKPVPGSGIAGVAVAAEARGRGLMRPMLSSLLAAARERGALVSALFPSTSVPYRRLGWERVGAITWTSVGTGELTAVRAPGEVALRAATPSDLPAVVDTYRAVARECNGLLDRSGPLFDAAKLLERFDGITLALGPDGAVEGYASWKREPDVVIAHDLIGRTARATQALLAMFGSWRSVVRRISLRLLAQDPALLLAPLESMRTVDTEPWMFRLVDAAGAVAARGWPADVSGAVELHITDDVCPWNAGAFRLELDGGAARLVPGGAGTVGLSPNGLAALYSGGAGPAVLRRAGLLTGGDAATDALLAAATAGPAPALLDSF